MKCDDVRGQLPDLALGDLDAEPARAVEEHLKGCAPCRAERETLSRAGEALRAAAPLPPSTERREAAVAGMARAHTQQVDALLARPRRRWIPWAAAAAVMIVTAVLLRPAAPVYTAVSGSADLWRASAGQWAPLLPGDVVHPGDRLRGEARLSVEGGWVLLEPGTLVAVLSDGRLSLDQGRLKAELGEGVRRPIVVTDTGNNSVTLRRGRIEAGLVEVKASVLRFDEEKGGLRTAPERPRTESALRLVVRVAEGEADLGGSHQQRLRLAPGQEGSFSIDGQPSTQAVQGR